MCGNGGIGRRASFRYLWATIAGSNPVSRTIFIMKKYIKKTLSIISNLSIAIMEFFALNHRYVACDRWGMFKMYTQNSNILLFICSTIFVIISIVCLLFKTQLPKFVKVLRYISTCTITLTMIIIYIYVFAITNPYQTERLFVWPMLGMHTLFPIISIVSFVFFEEKFKISFKQTFIAFIPTVIYGCVLTTLNICKVVNGPYFFFEVYNQPVYMSILWFCIIMMSAFIICLFYRMIYNSKFIKQKTHSSYVYRLKKFQWIRK